MARGLRPDLGERLPSQLWTRWMVHENYFREGEFTWRNPRLST